MPKVILVTQDWGGIGFAALMKKQGSDVIGAYDYDAVEDDDLESTELNGDGLVDKIELREALSKLTGKKALWVFDGNDLADKADMLSRAGELVVGTSGLSRRGENDRDFAVGLAESVGLKSPATEKFSNYDKAIKFLESRKSQAYVYKPYGEDPTATFVPLDADDPMRANEELREYLLSLVAEKGKPQFILQELVHGVEANFELWVRKGKPIAAFCDLESKRKLDGDLGAPIGCAGGYVFATSLTCRGIQSTVAKYLKLKEFAHYTGSVDANVMIVNGEPLFLENCFRFGFNAYPAILMGLAKDSVEDTLRQWVTGTHDMRDRFKTGFAGSLSLLCDNPVNGFPIMAEGLFPEKFYLYRGFEEDHRLQMVAGWPEIGCVVGRGLTPESAGNECLALAKQVSFPNVGYRLDLAHTNLSTLPIPRYRALQTNGWLR